MPMNHRTIFSRPETEIDPTRDNYHYALMTAALRWGLAAANVSPQEFIPRFFEEECPDRDQNWREGALSFFTQMIAEEADDAQEKVETDLQAATAYGGPGSAAAWKGLVEIAEAYREVLQKLEAFRWPEPSVPNEVEERLG